MSTTYISKCGNRIPSGSIVQLARFPDTKFILCCGWYQYGDVEYNGWYFKSIPMGEIIPATTDDFSDITIVAMPSTSYNHCDDHCGCGPAPSRTKSVEPYISGVSYSRGQLVWLVPGKLYQVVRDFVSSTRSDSSAHNLQIDMLNGDIEPIYKDPHSYAIRFMDVFGTDIPTRTITDSYLQSLEPPVEPNVGIKFINVDTASPTYLSVFEYFTLGNTLELLTYSSTTGGGGGMYITDKTLSVSDVAADAAVTGQRLQELADQITEFGDGYTLYAVL